jgi:hypothetical protein
MNPALQESGEKHSKMTQESFIPIPFYKIGRHVDGRKDFKKAGIS